MARLHERFGLAPRWERAGSGAGGAQCSAAGPAPAAPAVPGKPLSRHDAAEQPADGLFNRLDQYRSSKPYTRLPCIEKHQVSESHSPCSFGANQEILGATNREPGNWLDHYTLGASVASEKRPSQSCGSNFQKISVDRTDRRLYFPRQKSEITKYMEATWRLKEQSENMQ